MRAALRQGPWLIAAALPLLAVGAFAQAPLPLQMDFKLTDPRAADAGVLDPPPAAAPQPLAADRPSVPRLISVCDSCAAGSLSPFSGDLHDFALHTVNAPEHAHAEKLLRQHRRSLLYLYGGSAAGVLTAVVGMLAVPRQYCTFNEGTVGAAPGGQRCTWGPLNFGLGAAGLSIVAFSLVAYFVDRPSTGELVQVVNAWNDAHPDAPFLPKYARGKAAPGP